MNESIITEAAEKAQRQIQKRIDREIEAAWRAGYDYLYIGAQHTTDRFKSDENAFSVSYYVLPSHGRLESSPFDVGATEYDLTSMTREDIDRWK